MCMIWLAYKTGVRGVEQLIHFAVEKEADFIIKHRRGCENH